MVYALQDRFTADKCLTHPWLTDNRVSYLIAKSLKRNNFLQVYVDVLYTLETAWMKSILARRRWQRWYNAIAAARRIRRVSSSGSGEGFDSL